jgi:CRISPR/Cas system-associated exonuclease Cas4 (RecB family)
MAALDRIRDGLHISVSQIRSYLRCSRAFELRYVLAATPAFKPTAFAFGSAFHTALARYYVGLKEDGTPPSLQLVADSFRDAWKQEAEGEVPLQTDEDEPEDKGALLDRAVAMLGVFHAQAERALDGSKVEAVEQPFAVALFDPDTGEVQEERLVGVFDLVVSDGRHHTVVESKTASRKYGETETKWDIQPTGYLFAAKQEGMDDVRVRYQIVTKARTPAVQVLDLERTVEDEAEFLRVAVGVMRAVDAGIFMPVRSWACRSCPYQHVCRPAPPKPRARG